MKIDKDIDKDIEASTRKGILFAAGLVDNLNQDVEDLTNNCIMQQGIINEYRNRMQVLIEIILASNEDHPIEEEYREYASDCLNDLIKIEEMESALQEAS